MIATAKNKNDVKKKLQHYGAAKVRDHDEKMLRFIKTKKINQGSDVGLGFLDLFGTLWAETNYSISPKSKFSVTTLTNELGKTRA